MYNYGIKRKLWKKSDNDDGGFQQQIHQRLVDRYEHMNSRNERWTIILKGIQVEYYSIDNLKS